MLGLNNSVIVWWYSFCILTKLCIFLMIHLHQAQGLHNEWESGVHKCVEGAVDGALVIMANALSHFDHEAHTAVNCTPGEFSCMNILLCIYWACHLEYWK